MTDHIVFIGAGNMAGALISGLLADGTPPDRIIATDPSIEKCQALSGMTGIRTLQDNREAAILADVLVLAVKEKLDPLEVKGSYAGAMGQPQFIPSSYRNYAVDFDGDGRRDLWNSDADVIGSVANYFARHGWRADEPVVAPATGVNSDHKAMVTLENDKPKPPKYKIAALKEAGIQVSEEFSTEQLASLIQLSTPTGSEYWVGLHNFYVITRYNHSNLYAMAVYQLSQEILALRHSQQKPAK